MSEEILYIDDGELVYYINENEFITCDEIPRPMLEGIKHLQQKVEQLENIRREAIEFMKENCDIITIDKGWIIRSELTTTGLGKLFKILNKGSVKE